MMVDYEVQRIAEGEMGPDERLLWCGRPNPNRALGPGLCVMLFGIPFTLFALFWIVIAIGISGSFSGGFGLPAIFGLFGIPFVLASIALLTAPLWMARRLRNTVYALTNCRAIIVSKGWTRNVQSFTADTMGDLERRERADGSGDLIFARRLGTTTHFDNGIHDGHGFQGTHTHARTEEIGFFGIPNVREVEKLLRDSVMNA